MHEVGQPYTAGDWMVKAGEEEAFVEKWTAFVDWSQKTIAEARSFFLIRDTEEPRHFLSFGSWMDERAVSAWRQMPEFAELLGACRALCEQFEGRDYAVAATSTDA